MKRIVSLLLCLIFLCSCSNSKTSSELKSGTNINIKKFTEYFKQNIKYYTQYSDNCEIAFSDVIGDDTPEMFVGYKEVAQGYCYDIYMINNGNVVKYDYLYNQNAWGMDEYEDFKLSKIQDSKGKKYFLYTTSNYSRCISTDTLYEDSETKSINTYLIDFNDMTKHCLLFLNESELSKGKVISEGYKIDKEILNFDISLNLEKDYFNVNKEQYDEITSEINKKSENVIIFTTGWVKADNININGIKY